MWRALPEERSVIGKCIEVVGGAVVLKVQGTLA